MGIELSVSNAIGGGIARHFMRHKEGLGPNSSQAGARGGLRVSYVQITKAKRQGLDFFARVRSESSAAS